jgi:hypothetical protein
MLPRRSSDPSNLHSPAPGTTYEAAISSSPPQKSHSPLRNRSPLRNSRESRPKQLIPRHSSGGSVPPSPQPVSTTTKPRHVRAKTRFAGRFEVMDLDFLNNSFQDPNNNAFLMNNGAAVATAPQAMIKEEDCCQDALFAPESSPVLVCSKKRDHVKGRFQISEISESPPRTEVNSVGMRRVQSAEMVSTSQEMERDSYLVPTTTATPAQSTTDLSKTMPHTSLVGRFQIIEMPSDSSSSSSSTSTAPPELLRQPEVLLAPTPNHSRTNSASSIVGPDVYTLGLAGESSDRGDSPVRLLPIGGRPSAAGSDDGKQIGEKEMTRASAAELLDGFDSADLMSAVTRKMQILAEEVEKLRRENKILKQQVKLLSSSSTPANTPNFRN